MKAVSFVLLQQLTDSSAFYAAPEGKDEDCFAPSKYTAITRTDYINWTGVTNDTAITELLSGIPGERRFSWGTVPGEKPVFERDEALTGWKSAKIRIRLNEEWVKTFDVRVVDIEEISSMRESGRYRDYIWYEETKDEMRLIENRF